MVQSSHTLRRIGVRHLVAHLLGSKYRRLRTLLARDYSAASSLRSALLDSLKRATVHSEQLGRDRESAVGRVEDARDVAVDDAIEAQISRVACGEVCDSEVATMLAVSYHRPYIRRIR
jgi:hypothetical protein